MTIEDLDRDDIDGERRPDPVTGSLADRIRRQHREIKEAKYLNLRIPGPAGIVVRFKPVGAKVIEKLGKKKADERYGKLLTLALDVLARGCERVLIYAPDEPGADEDGLVPFEQVFDLGDEPIKLSDPRLAEALGETATSTREIIVAVYPTEEAIMLAFKRFDVWSADVTAEVDEGLEGE